MNAWKIKQQQKTRGLNEEYEFLYHPQALTHHLLASLADLR